MIVFINTNFFSNYFYSLYKRNTLCLSTMPKRRKVLRLCIPLRKLTYPKNTNQIFLSTLRLASSLLIVFSVFLRLASLAFFNFNPSAFINAASVWLRS